MVNPLLDEIIEADGERHRVAPAGLILDRGLAVEATVDTASAR